MARVLKSTKPIPAAYLKAGKDKGAYDQEVLWYLPGRTTPVRRPDLRLIQRKGVRDAGIARPAPPPGTQPLIVPRRIAEARRGKTAAPKLEIVKR